VDETFLGGEEPGPRGRGALRKKLVVIAAERDGKGIGRIRMRVIPKASGENLLAFVKDSVEPGSTLHTDGWGGYNVLEREGYHRRVTLLNESTQTASQLLPCVHRVASLVKRWLLGTHHGGVSPGHLDYYLDEFTFRFNRRTSRHRGLLFYRLIENAVAIEPVPYGQIVGSTGPTRQPKHKM